MARITKECIDRLNDTPLYMLFDAEGSGFTKHCACPKCGANGKKKGSFTGLRVTDDQVKRRHIVKCGSCGFGAGGGAINVMMKTFDMEFQDACQKIADMTGRSIEYEEARKADKVRKAEARAEGSFCARQLEESGLTYDDVKASVYVGDDLCTVSPFRRGSLDPMTGKVDELADEMIILYYDLEGRRRKYIPASNRTREMDYTRVRWSNPDNHRNRQGKSIKYQTPAGAKAELYIPEKVRAMYRTKSKFDTLYIQEGEKKAEKACKHGLLSVAMQGIGNIGRKDAGLPPDIQYIVQTCGVRNIVFLMDADWNDLKRELNDDDRVDARPRDFARALIKFKKFVGTLALCKIHVDIWFAHVNDNEAHDKGVDDLLTNTLKGCEHQLKERAEEAMIAHDGHTDLIDVVNITTFSDSKIMDFWCLNNKDDFFEIHRERLTQLHSFKFGDVFYKVDNGTISMASEFGSGNEFWKVSYDDKGKKKIEIDLIDMLSFLTANGHRSMKADGSRREFVRIEGGIINRRDEFDLRQFVLNYVYKATKDHAVHLQFAESIANKLSMANLCQLDLLETSAGIPTKDGQRFYFANREVFINHAGITGKELTGPVWRENTIPREFERIPVFSRFGPDGKGGYDIALTQEGQQCEFFRFLKNTCDFWDGKITPDNEREHSRHLANKITCLGYLLRDYKSPVEAKAVIAMDSAMSEVGVSRGRTGKSFMGMAVSKFLSQTVIDGRNLANDDPYMFSGVTRRTKNIFIDDINPNFDIGRFYQRITSDLNVNVKQAARFYIPFAEAPKFLITTNHALDNVDDSAMARLVFMAFSDHYSKDYTPRDEFGHMFFDEWDDMQWRLFDNFICECVQIYIRSAEEGWEHKGMGAVDPPMDNLRRRALRQEMGELFLQWADQFYSRSGGMLNQRLARKTIFEAYLNEYNQKATAVSAKTFRNKIIAYCKFSGYHLNPTRKDNKGRTFLEFHARYPNEAFIGDRETANSLEYYTLATTEYLTKYPPI